MTTGVFSTDTLGLWVLVALASWVQTLTGFALGLILMGGVGLFGFLPLRDAAIVTSVLVVVNGLMMLARGWRDLDRRAAGLFICGSVPGLIAGYAALEWMAGRSLDLLQFLLGFLIAASALQLATKPRLRADVSPAGSFIGFGAAGGILGGMFATAGPPIIYHIYRQPLPMAQIRVTLVTVFLTNQILRLGIVSLGPGVPMPVLLAAAGAIPAVLVGTTIARRWPPPLTPAQMRQMAFGLLFISGLLLMWPAAARFF